MAVNITPHSVTWERFTNKTSNYALGLDTIGPSTRLDIIQRFGNNDNIARVSQDYVGSQKMNLVVSMSDSILRDRLEDEWLPCCAGGWDTMKFTDKKGFGSSAEGIFNCACYKAPARAQ